MASQKSKYDELMKKYGVKRATTFTNNGKQSTSASPSSSKPTSSNKGSSVSLNNSSGGSSKYDELMKKHGVKRNISSTSQPKYNPSKSTTKLTDFNTETKNAYTTVKNKLNTNTTFTSNVTEEERNKRLKEIKSELGTLNTKLSGYSRAKAYGTSKAMIEEEKKVKARIAELTQEAKTLERTGTFSATELKQFEIDDAKQRESAARQKVQSFGQRPSVNDAEAYRQAVSELFKATEELDEVKRQKDLYDDITKFGDVVNEDTFVGQWKANYRSNEISREADKAISRYIDNPTEENKELAYAYVAFAEEYLKNNEKALDDENVKASWLTKSMAGYLPQFKDQILPEVTGGLVGGILGSAAGAPTVGASIGAGLATSAQSYNVIRGSVYRTLLAEGVDEEVALSAAKDEALISSLIEGGETALGWLLAGGGKAIGAISGAAKASVAKGSTNMVTKFLANFATNRAAKSAAKVATRPLWNKAARVAGGVIANGLSEYGEEFAQQGVSIANKERAKQGETGKWNLSLNAGEVIADAIRGNRPEALAEMHEAGTEGFKIGVMFGGSNAIVNNVVTHYANAKTVKQQNEVVDAVISDEETLNALIEEGKASGEGTFSEKIATEVEASKEKGEVTREQVKKLIASNEVYIREEENLAEYAVTDNAPSSTNTPIKPQPISSVKVGDVYVANGKTFTITNIDNGTTTYTITDENGGTTTNSVSNVTANNNFTNSRMFTKVVETSETPSISPENNTTNTSRIQEEKPFKAEIQTAHEKAVEAAFEAGRQNVPREKINLATIEQEEAYNRGRIEHIKNMPKVTGEIADRTNTEFGNGKRSGDIASGQKNELTDVNAQTNAPYNVMANDNPMLQERKAREAYIESVTGYGRYGVQAFANIMETVSESEAPAIAKSFQVAYEAGLTNMDRARVELPSAVHNIAFNAGKQDFIMESASKKENLKNVRSHGDKAGLDPTNVPSKVSKQAIDIVDRICKALGVVARVVGKSDEFNADISKNVGVVRIASDFTIDESLGEDAISLSFVKHALHEIADHRAEELAPAEYSEFKREMYNYLNSGHGVSEAKAKRKAYSEKGVDISLSEAMSEVTANSILELYDNDLDLLQQGLNRVLNGTNAKAKKGANVFKQALDYVIEKFNKLLERLGLKAKQTYKPLSDDILRIRDAFENTLGAAIAKNKEIAKTGQKISSKNLEIKTNEVYNGNTRYSVKWHTDLSRTQIKQVAKWLREAGSPESTRITDTANWYKGRINGQPLFVIYSTVYGNDPTILYETRGVNANLEKDILMDLLEEIKNGESNDRKSAYVNWVSGGGWVQKVNNSTNNLGNVGGGQNNQNAGVLQRQSQRNGSPAFWNVLDYIFKESEVKKYSLKVNGKDTKTEYNENINHSFDNDGVIDKSDFIGYVPITKVKMKTFPPYNKSKSDANERATRWAHREDVEAGAQTLAFYHNRCYVIGKYDSAELKYLIDGRISYKAYESIRKELEADARNRENQSKKKMVDFLRERNERRNIYEGRGQSVDYSSVEHRREDRDLLRLGRKQDGEREVHSDIGRSDEYDSKDRTTQGLNDEKGFPFKVNGKDTKTEYNENINHSLYTDEVMFSSRYESLDQATRNLYDLAKSGDFKSAYKMISHLLKEDVEDKIRSLGNDVYLLPVIGAEGTSANVLPRSIAEHISDNTGQNVFKGIAKDKPSNSRNKTVWGRMKENYPSFVFDERYNIKQSDIEGKKFVLIDDNSTTGRTFVGLKNLIEEYGGKVVGYYALTTGQDQSEKMITTKETWEELLGLGFNKVKEFAEKEGIKREISRPGLSERESQELIKQFRRENAISKRGFENDTRSGNGGRELQEIQKTDGSTEKSNEIRDSLKGTEKNIPLRDIPKVQKAVADRNAEVLAKYVDSGAISTEVYQQLIEEFGAIQRGENPSRDVQVPQRTAEDKKVSQTVRTILEAKATPDEAVPTIEKMVEDGVFSYDVYTDKQAIENGEAYIKKHGWDESVLDWFEAVNSGEVSKDLTTTGWILYNHAANLAVSETTAEKRVEAAKIAVRVLDAMVRHQRSAAQALQATRILKKLSPNSQLYGIQKSVEAYQEELKNKYGKKAPNLEIDESLVEQFLNAETEEARMDAEREIYKDIGRQMPADWLDKWNAWRYLAMLGNLRTHGKNIVGNAGFAPVVLTKDLLATAIESSVAFVARKSGKKMARSKALVWGSKTDRALLEAAWGDFANVIDLIENGGKYNDSAIANKYIEEGRRIFRNKLLEWLRTTNSGLLSLEDMWFSKPHYAYAMAQYCKANNITAEQIAKGVAIAPAREYAIKEAQKATYRDTNEVSEFISKLGRSGKANQNKWEKRGRAVVEGNLPFRKTPANILVRGIEYSPLGLLKSLTKDLKKIGKEVDGRVFTASDAIDNISAGLTGTGLLILGIYLTSQGLIRGHGEDDEKEKEFNEMMGHQAYSLETRDGKSYTLDWLAPEALPFFIGVNIYEINSRKKPDEMLTMSDMITVATRIGEPMLQMSCLQGINDALENIGFAQSQGSTGLMSFLSGSATSYLTQGVPTLLGQFERTGEENRMTTFVQKDAFLTKGMQRTVGKVSAKIPFWDYNQIPYIDAWGRKEASGPALKRGLNNFLNPAYTSTIESSAMENELLRLYEKLGDGAVFPERADKYFMVDGERKDLTADEYVRYATLKGEKSYKLVTELVGSDSYKKLSDEEKVKAIEEAYDYANQKAKQAISRYKPETWVSKADEFGSNVENYISFKVNVSATKKANGDKVSKQEVADIILDTAQSDSEMWKMYLSMYESENANYAYEKGIDGETYMLFLEALEEHDKPTKTGKYGTYTQDEAKQAIKSLGRLSRQEKATLWQSVNTTWKKNPYR